MALEIEKEEENDHFGSGVGIGFLLAVVVGLIGWFVFNYFWQLNSDITTLKVENDRIENQIDNLDYKMDARDRWIQYKLQNEG